MHQSLLCHSAPLWLFGEQIETRGVPVGLTVLELLIFLSCFTDVRSLPQPNHKVTTESGWGPCRARALLQGPMTARSLERRQRGGKWCFSSWLLDWTRNSLFSVYSTATYWWFAYDLQLGLCQERLGIQCSLPFWLRGSGGLVSAAGGDWACRRYPENSV